MDISNYYSILGIPRDASLEEIKQAYREKAKQYHPDVAGEETRYLFQLVNEAYDALSSQDLRDRHDSELKPATSNEDQNHRFDNFNKDSNTSSKVEIKQSINKLGDILSRSADTRPSRDEPAQEPQPNDPSIKGRESITQRSYKRRDFEDLSKKRTYQFSISVLECLKGAHRDIVLNLDGKTTKATVYIPPGVKHGETRSLIVIPLEVDQIVPDNVDAMISVTGNDYLDIDGLTLTLHLPLTVREAMEGVEVAIPTAKSAVKVLIPPLTVNRKPLRIKGHGIEDPETKERGDLIVRPFIVPPDRTSPALEQALRACDAHYSGDVRGHLPRTFSAEKKSS